MLRALTVAADGGKDDIAKPSTGVDGGVFEIAMKHMGNAFRTIYAVRLGASLWVIDAFQKSPRAELKHRGRTLPGSRSASNG